MEHPAPLASKILFGLFILSAGCNFAKTSEVPALSLNRAQQTTTITNGLLYVNGQLFSGTLYSLYPETNDTSETQGYLNGKEQGEWKKFYPHHQIRETRFFDNGQKTGEYLAWWPNGQRQLQYFFKDDEYEGTCREWNSEGRLTKIMNYKKGYEAGHQEWWYNNGKVKANYVIIDGRRYGLLGTKNCTNVSDSIFKK